MNVLIIGGAGKIGIQTALDIALKGWTPIIADVNSERLNNASKKLRKYKHYCILADISTQSGIKDCISQSHKDSGQIDAAIYSAYPRSKGWSKAFEEINEDNLAEDLKLQLGSAILFSKEIITYFLKQGFGNLIHISSIQGISAPKFSHYKGTNMVSPIEYSAIKSGIIAITKWLAKYYKGTNIRINCISPGGIKDNQPNIFIERYKKDCSNIGMLDPSHISSAILFLLSSDSIAINGQNLIIDDGWSL